MKNKANLFLIGIICIGLILCSFFLFREDIKTEFEETKTLIGKFVENVQPVAIQAAIEQVTPGDSSSARAYPSALAVAAPDGTTGATPRIIAWVGTIIQQAKPAVVGICVGDTTQSSPWMQGWEIFSPTGRRSVGSGVIINPQGYIITNYHVVAMGGSIVISVFDEQAANGYVDYSAQIISASQNNDLALLKIEAPDRTFPAMPIGNSDKVRTGDKTIAIGNPFGLTQTVTSGIVSAKRSRLPIGGTILKNVLQLDVPINPGNSGGAMVNMYGELVGINTAIYSPVESLYTGVSFAIPINQAKKLFTNFIDLNTKPATFQWTKAQQQNVGRGFRFVAATNANPNANTNADTQMPLPPNLIQPSPGEGIEELAWLGIDIVPDNDANVSQSIIVVDEIEGISPMEAGLQAGDVIKSVNGIPTPNIYAFKEAIKNVPIKVGQGVVLDVFRPRNSESLYISFRLKQWDIKGR